VERGLSARASPCERQSTSAALALGTPTRAQKSLAQAVTSELLHAAAGRGRDGRQSGDDTARESSGRLLDAAAHAPGAP